MAEEPVNGNTDNADLDTTAEELEVEDPGLRDLALRLTEHALHQGSLSPDNQLQAAGSQRLSRGTAAAVRTEPVDASNGRSGQQQHAAEADTEMMLLQVSSIACCSPAYCDKVVLGLCLISHAGCCMMT